MITVLRASGLRIVIFKHDHDPPHVHVIGDGEAKLLLIDDGSPEVIDVRGMKFGDLRKAVDAVREHQAFLLSEWRRIHD